MDPRRPHRRAAFTPSGFANRVPPRPFSSAWGGGGALEAQVRQFLTGASAAEHYDLNVLRLGGIAPPTLPPLPRPGHATARDGDLARQEARMRYSQQLLTRSQLNLAREQARQATLFTQPVAAEPTTFIGPTPQDEYHTEAAYRGRMAAQKILQAMEQQAQDQPEMVAIARGVGHGFAEVPMLFLPELAGARFVAGLRYAESMRAATAARNLAWASEAELIGGRAAWQGFRTIPWQASAKQVFFRGSADYTAQTTANLLTGDKDPLRNFNTLETGMAAFGLRPAVIGFGSAAINLNSRGYLKTVFHTDYDHRIYPGSFLGQAVIGTAVGRGALALESRLLERGSRNAAVGLYMNLALRQPRLAYPLGLGLYHLGHKGVPLLLGVVEETGEGTADNLFTPPRPLITDSANTKLK